MKRPLPLQSLFAGLISEYLQAETVNCETGNYLNSN